MPDIIQAGGKTLDLLLFLAERGAVTEIEAAEFLDESKVQARRYLHTLASRGFAKHKRSFWIADLNTFRLPQLYIDALRRRLNAVVGDLSAFTSCLLGGTTKEGTDAEKTI